MLASVDKKGATLSDILRADGYGLGGASEQAIEQAVEGLALDAKAVQGCASGVSSHKLHVEEGLCAAGLAAACARRQAPCRACSDSLCRSATGTLTYRRFLPVGALVR